MGTSEPKGSEDPANGSPAGRFGSWKEIAAHLGRAVSTVQRWEKQEGLPVHRHLHNKQGTVYAYRSEIDAWWRDRRVSLERSPEPTSSRRFAKPAAVAVALVATLVAAWVWRRLSPAAVGPETVRPVRLTSLEGAELDPALSPDGRQLAFIWEGGGSRGLDLYVQPVGGTSPFRLTQSGSICCPAWSPDGRTLAFVRTADTAGDIITIPVSGGAERRLGTVHPWFGLGLAWSPEGQRIVYSDRPSANEPHGLVAIAVDTLKTEPLTRPDPAQLGDAFPAFSPDGRRLAFARVSASGDALPADLYVLPEGGSEPRRLTHDQALIGGLDFSPDGRSVVYAAVRKGEDPRIFRLPVDEEGTRPVPVAGPRPTEVVVATVAETSHDLRLSVSRRSSRIAYVQGSYDTNVWAMEMPTRLEPSPPARRLIASTLPDEAPQYSPDGRTIAFSTSRSGHGEIWTCAVDGTSCTALTTSGVHSGTPRWSPDGKKIAFDSRPEGQSDIFVIDVASRQVVRVTTSPADDVVPSWSADNRTIYFASNRTGTWEVWRADTKDDSSSPITTSGGFAAFEKGDSVYYTKQSEPGLWRVPKGGGEPARLATGPRCWGHWAVASDGVYLLDAESEGRTSLDFLAFGAATSIRAGSFAFKAPCAESSLAVSPDGRKILYVAAEKSADIMMVELPR